MIASEMEAAGIASSSEFYGLITFAAGIAGNVFAFALFISPLPTFKRIVTNKSTEQFSGLPYIYTLLNCLICMWYGLPFVSYGVVLVATVNSIGATFQLVYITIFIIFADTTRKLKMSGMLIGVFVIFAIIIYTSLEFCDHKTRQIFVGYLSVASLICMFASPLSVIASVPRFFINFNYPSSFQEFLWFHSQSLTRAFAFQNLVIRTRSVEFMPFYLSLATFLMSFSFFAYGLFLNDFFIYLPNGIGTILGLVQLLLYAYYSRQSSQDAQRPLLV